MIVAFDFNGTAEHLQVLRDLATAMLKAGHECHIISAIGHEKHKAVIHDTVAKLGVPWTRIHFVIFPRPLEIGGAVEYEIGLEKARIMREIGAGMIFEDNQYIARAVRDRGMVAALIK